MKPSKFFYVFCVFFLIPSFFCNGEIWAVTGEAARTIAKLEAGKIDFVKLPANLRKGKINNGFFYYMLEDDELPIVNGIIYIRGGWLYLPSEKDGLSSLATNLMLSGGTKKLAPHEVDLKLDQIASVIKIESGSEVMTASFKCRADQLENTLNLLLDMLFTPRFDPERYELIKQQMRASIKRRKDEPDVLASLGFNSLLYGKGNSWGSYATTETVGKITIEEVVDFHKKFFHPDNMIVGISGDIEPSQVLKILKSYGDYPSGKGPDPVIAKGMAVPKEGAHIVEKDKTQVIMNIGHQGSIRFRPENYAIIVMNDILGSPRSLKSRLASSIRVKRGLAYSVASTFEFGPPDTPGIFKIYAATKTESALDVIKLIKKELTEMKEGENITEEELNLSKNSILNQLVFSYATAFDVISKVVHYNYFGYPDNYAEEYGEMISKVTLDDVKNVAKKYLHPEKLQYVLAGKRDSLEKQLNNYMKVEDLTIEE